MKALFINNLKLNFFHKYFSYFLEQNILIFNQCNSKTLKKEENIY